MSLIEDVSAREILDSRGNPTVEVDVVLDDGALGRAAVPSGASTGEHEALELRDAEPGRYHGKGVLHAIANVNGPIAKAVQGLDASSLTGLPDEPPASHAVPHRRRVSLLIDQALNIQAQRRRAAAAD